LRPKSFFHSLLNYIRHFSQQVRRWDEVKFVPAWRGDQYLSDWPSQNILCFSIYPYFLDFKATYYSSTNIFQHKNIAWNKMNLKWEYLTIFLMKCKPKFQWTVTDVITWWSSGTSNQLKNGQIDFKQLGICVGTQFNFKFNFRHRYCKYLFMKIMIFTPINIIMHMHVVEWKLFEIELKIRIFSIDQRWFKFWKLLSSTELVDQTHFYSQIVTRIHLLHFPDSFRFVLLIGSGPSKFMCISNYHPNEFVNDTLSQMSGLMIIAQHLW
jgi:hypothetical protein